MGGFFLQRQKNFRREDAGFVLAVQPAVVLFDDLVDAAQAVAVVAALRAEIRVGALTHGFRCSVRDGDVKLLLQNADIDAKNLMALSRRFPRITQRSISETVSAGGTVASHLTGTRSCSAIAIFAFRIASICRLPVW